MTINFANNNLNGNSRFLENYKTSKTRICVTVGMMTTGYDCQDILNLALMRPIFSPTDFVQIKGRGTRKHNFIYQDQNKETHQFAKTTFKLFDFFANCEYFEEKFNYDEVLKLPNITQEKSSDNNQININNYNEIEIFNPDKIKELREEKIGLEGMKIDRKLYEDQIRKDEDIKGAIDKENWGQAINIVRDKYENKPNLFLNLEKIKKSENLDRRISWREVLEKIFGLIDDYKNSNEILEDECDKFISIHKPDSQYIPHIKNYLKSYVTDEGFRNIINSKDYGCLNTYAGFSIDEFKALNGFREIVPEYIKDYIPLNQFM